MSQYGLELAEEPVHGLEALARVRAGTGVRVAADESVADPRDAARGRRPRRLRPRHREALQGRGFAALREIAAVLPVYLSSALDGPVGIAAAAHAAQALRDSGDAGVAHGLATQRLFAETIAAVECELRGGMLHPPEGPGLGVVIDEEALARHRL